ncbi:MAG: serine/threonine-protein kinase [Planctomycetota bacterium]|nr:serine/threonine-protein kinase [Planctomycetota bacterium]
MADPRSSPQSLLDDYLARHAAGEAPEFEDWVEQHAELADELRALHERRPRRERQSGSFFRRQFSTGAEAAQVAEVELPAGRTHRAGEQIDDYRLEQFLGMGGMGEVWQAKQLSLGRAVALKLILPNRIDPEDLKHLVLREARAGGLSTHPNVVTTLAVGTFRGMPWIAQELIDGSCTLKDFLDDLRASDQIPEGYYRLAADFVAQLADGLQAAHEGGVIHRDVKPQNVLIGPDDRPKLADFGLARVEGDSVFSRSGDFAGTYAYMSPEQVTAKRMGLDHRTDIFSLGIVLYEMLALRRPFEGDTTHQIATRIIAFDPPDPSKVRSQCPRELAVIAAKALEKDPERRYQTMAELAADLRRHLANEPIQARPPGHLRRAQKWALRNPTKSTAAAIGLLSLVIISVLLLRTVDKNKELARVNEALATKTGELDREKAKLEEERDRLAKMVGFQEGFFDDLEPNSYGARLRLGIQDELVATLEGRGTEPAELERAVAALQDAIAAINFTNPGIQALRDEILEPVQVRIAEGFGEDSLTRAALQSSIADAYERLGFFDPALELKLASLELRREVLGDDDPATLEGQNDVGYVLRSMGELQAALPYYEAALEGRRRILGDEDPATLTSVNNMGSLLASMGQLDEALPYYEEALAKRRQILGEDDRETLASLNNMGHLFESMGRFDEAMIYFQDALARKRLVLGDEDQDTLTSVNNMGSLLLSMDRAEEALPYYEEALELRRQVLGDRHPDTLVSLNNMGYLLQRMDRPDEAMPYLLEAMEKKREVLGPQHPSTINGTNNMGYLLESMGRFAEALPYYEEAARGALAVWGSLHEETLNAEDSLGYLLVRLGELDEARAVLEPALLRARQALPEGHEVRNYLMQSLVSCYDGLHAKDALGGYDQLGTEMRLQLAREEP